MFIPKTIITNTHSSNSQAKLAHGVKRRRASVKDLLHEFGNGGTSCPIFGQLCDLLLGGDFSSNQKPEKGLRKRFSAAWSLRKLVLDIGDGLAAETDALL